MKDQDKTILTVKSLPNYPPRLDTARRYFLAAFKDISIDEYRLEIRNKNA
jgi:hypothetical protein